MAYTQTKSYAPLLSDKVRILVVGDMSVGKTSLVNLICEGKVLQNPNWTIGCKAEVKLHDYKGKPFFVEFLDVGGSPKHENSRSIFYSQFNGVILAHDLTNRKSYINLKRWIKEILNAVSPSDRTKWSIKNEKHMLELQHEDQNNFYPIPIMVVANKLDLVRPDSTSYLNNDDLGTESVLVSAWDQSSFGPNTPSGYSLDSFLNRTISNALAPRSKGVKINAPSSPDMSRRRSGSFDRLQRLGLKYDLKRKDLDPSRLKGGELYSDDSTPDPSPRDLRSLSPRDVRSLSPRDLKND